MRFLYRKMFAMLLVLSLFCSGINVFAAQYENLQDLGLQSKSAILMEGDTGHILYEQNSHEKLAPASITKVMTLLLIYEAEKAGQFAWEDSVSVSEHAASMGGSQVFLEPMEQQTAADMTKSIAIASANDAAVAMAEFVAGSEEAFVERMNQRAKELEMNDTHFVNACGLDAEGHLTSAYDIAVMSRELITKHPEIKEYTTTWQDTIVHKTKRGDETFGLTNTNKLLKWYEGTTGLKTGSTGKALYCFSGTAERDGLKLIGVVMAAPDFKVRFQEVMKLLDYGYANYAVEPGKAKGTYVADIPVQKGMEDSVPVVIGEDISVLRQKTNTILLDAVPELLPSVRAPIAAGTKVGEMIYRIDGEEAARADVVAGESVEVANIEATLRSLMKKWCE